ncbi:hypothetical protein HK405_000788, partial [Cladochytrium tenue]
MSDFSEMEEEYEEVSSGVVPPVFVSAPVQDPTDSEHDSLAGLIFDSTDSHMPGDTQMDIGQENHGQDGGSTSMPEEYDTPDLNPGDDFVDGVDDIQFFEDRNPSFVAGEDEDTEMDCSATMEGDEVSGQAQPEETPPKPDFSLAADNDEAGFAAGTSTAMVAQQLEAVSPPEPPEHGNDNTHGLPVSPEPGMFPAAESDDADAHVRIEQQLTASAGLESTQAGAEKVMASEEGIVNPAEPTAAPQIAAMTAVSAPAAASAAVSAAPEKSSTAAAPRRGGHFTLASGPPVGHPLWEEEQQRKKAAEEAAQRASGGGGGGGGGSVSLQERPGGRRDSARPGGERGRGRRGGGRAAGGP